MRARHLGWVVVGCLGCAGAAPLPEAAKPAEPIEKTESVAVASAPPAGEEGEKGTARSTPLPALSAVRACPIPSKLEAISVGPRSSVIDAVSIDGALVSTRLITAGGVSVVVYGATGTQVVSTAALDPRAIAWSFDAKRQVVADGEKLRVRESDGTTRLIAGATAPAPTAPTDQSGGSMSEDGRFLVVADQPAVFDLLDNTSATVTEPPIAGGSNAAYRIDPTGRFLFAENSRASFVGKLSRESTTTVAWTPSSTEAQQTLDGAVSLEVPRQPFAQDWVSTFDIHGNIATQLPLKLKSKEPFAAALCPGGNLVAVLAKQKLGFYATDSGKLLFEKSIRAVAGPRTNALDDSPGPKTMAFVDGGKSLFVRSGDREVVLRLVP